MLSGKSDTTAKFGRSESVYCVHRNWSRLDRERSGISDLLTCGNDANWNLRLEHKLLRSLNWRDGRSGFGTAGETRKLDRKSMRWTAGPVLAALPLMAGQSVPVPAIRKELCESCAVPMGRHLRHLLYLGSCRVKAADHPIHCSGALTAYRLCQYFQREHTKVGGFTLVLLLRVFDGSFLALRQHVALYNNFVAKVCIQLDFRTL